jgi:hypothetical protein
MSNYSIARTNKSLEREIIKRMDRVREIENLALDTPQRKRAYTLAINRHNQAITTYFAHCKTHNIEIEND